MKNNYRSVLAEVKAVLSSWRQQSPRTRQSYATVMRGIVKDLYRYQIGEIATFHALTDGHVNQLIHQWKEKGLSSLTIANRLTILRNYQRIAKISPGIPSNAELGIHKPQLKKKKQPLPINEKLDEQVSHPLTKLCIQLQMHLGLSKTESMRFQLNDFIHDGTRQIMISRDVSETRRDRVVPLYHDHQHQVLKSYQALVKDHLNLLSLLDARSLSQLYNAELKFLGLPIHYPFRAVYVRNRYRFLALRVGCQEKDVLNQLSRETGIVTISLIQRWINHEQASIKPDLP